MKEIILHYFGRGCLLKVLDRHPFKKYYTGVTLEYIHEYVLSKEYPFIEVGIAVKELVESFNLRMLYCGHLNDIVFETLASQHWSYNSYYGSYVNPYLNPNVSSAISSYEKYWSNKLVVKHN